MRALYPFLGTLPGLLALFRRPVAFGRNRAWRAAVRGVSREMR